MNPPFVVPDNGGFQRTPVGAALKAFSIEVSSAANLLCVNQPDDIR
jgi:hypothetical protein